MNTDHTIEFGAFVDAMSEPWFSLLAESAGRLGFTIEQSLAMKFARDAEVREATAAGYLALGDAPTGARARAHSLGVIPDSRRVSKRATERERTRAGFFGPRRRLACER